MQNIKSRLHLEEIDDQSLKAFVAITFIGKELAEILYGPQKLSLNSEIYSLDTIELLSRDPQLAVDFSQLRNAIANDLSQYTEMAFKNPVRLGFPTCVWLGIEKLNVRPQISGLAELALDSGFYKIALNLGLENDFSRARALILQGMDLNVPLTMSELETKAINMMQLRREGKFLHAQEIFENEILGQLPQCEDNRLVGEIYYIAGSAYINSTEFARALEMYTMAVTYFDKAQAPFRATAAAYNAAISSLNGCFTAAHDEWIAQTQNRVQQIHFDALTLSMRVHEVHSLHKAEKFPEAVAKSKLLLDKAHLSHFQRIELMQVYAKSALELGQVLDANIYSNYARQVLFANKLYQYELDQLSLENNIESLCYLRTTKITLSNNPNRSLDKAAYGEYRLSCIRQALNENNLALVRKTSDEIRREIPDPVLAQLYTRDLDLALTPYNIFPEKRARGLQTQVLQALRHRDLPFSRLLVAHLEEDLKASHNPWKESLLLIARSYAQISQGLTALAANELIRALDITSANGLMRLYSISLGLLVVCDNHFEMQWLEHLKGLEAADRIAVQDFFKAALGNQLSTLYLVISNNRRDLSLDQSNSEADLIINQESGEVRYMGQVLQLSGQSLLFLLLNNLARAQKQGLSKEEIIKQVWGYSYDPVAHDPLVYINIKRLRDLVPIEIHAGRYRISPQISWQFVVPAEIEDRKLNLTPRQVSIVNFIQRADDKSVSRSDIVRLLGISPRTALRELTEMVEKKFLVRQGAGRSARYLSPGAEVSL